MEGLVPLIDQENSSHAHRWRIEEPKGHFSRGLCKICGAERLFKNSLSELDFIHDERLIHYWR